MGSFVLNMLKNKRYNIKKENKDSMYRSRKFFILEGVTGIGQNSLTAGAFLAGFIKLLEGSEQINGMVAVIPAIVGLLQIFSSLIFEKLESRKKTIISMAIVLRTLLSIVYFIPMFLIPYGLGLQSFVICYILAYSMQALVVPAIVNWIVELTPLSIRGQYLAYRDKISLGIIAIVTIVLGKVLDYSKDMGNQITGFAVVGVIITILGIINIYALFNIDEFNDERIVKKVKLRDVLITPIKDTSFRKIIILFILWNFALQIGGPYIAVYMVTKLNLKYTYMMTLSVIATVVRVIVSNVWGRIADKKSWFLSTKCSIGLLAIVHFSWGFVNLSNYIVLAPLLHIIAGIAWGGIGISMFNIQFLFAKKEGRTMYIGLNAAIGGIFSGISVWIGGQLIKVLEDNQLTLFHMPINSIQITFFLSGILLMLCPLFVKIFIEKKDLKQEVE
ncbi:MAG: MFS transporter [Vallitalea sp.]|jgi:MFS family permease|nr:MFS transporter [Vallitalea sp.]